LCRLLRPPDVAHRPGRLPRPAENFDELAGRIQHGPDSRLRRLRRSDRTLRGSAVLAQLSPDDQTATWFATSDDPHSREGDDEQGERTSSTKGDFRGDGTLIT
jgi:hypothetical protein